MGKGQTLIMIFLGHGKKLVWEWSCFRSLTGEAYVNMLNEEIVPQMMEIFDFNLFGGVLFENVWWFQDGTSAKYCDSAAAGDIWKSRCRA